MHCHWLDGDPATRRVHVSSHQLVQQVGSKNTKRTDPRYYFKPSVGVWCHEVTLGKRKVQGERLGL